MTMAGEVPQGYNDMSKTMTINQAAHKWKLSPNWVRTLITSKRIPAQMSDGPVAYYMIPADLPKPPSMQRSPARLGSKKKVKPESIARREYRAKQAKLGVKKPKATRKAKAKKSA